MKTIKMFRLLISILHKEQSIRKNNENIGVINQFSTEQGQFDDVEALAAEICSVGLPNMPQDPNEYDQYLMHLFKNSKIMK